MDIFVVGLVLAWQIADLQAAATAAPLPAASQHVGSTASGSQLSSASISFTYWIFPLM